MKKLIIFLLVFDMIVFAFGRTYVSKRNGPQQFDFRVYAETDYSAAIYRKVKAAVLLKLVRVNNNVPTILWEKNLAVEDLSRFPKKANAIIRKINLGFVDENTYLVYKVSYDSKGDVLEREDAVLINRDNPILYIGI